MNPFLDEYEDAIPLKTRNYSNYNATTDTFMEETKDNHDDQNGHNNEESYGTFNANRGKSEPTDNKQAHKTHAVIPKSPKSLKSKIPCKEVQTIRTDKHTNTKYRRLRSIPIAENAVDNLDYEKEVYGSLGMYQIMPRNESLQHIFNDHQSQMINQHSNFTPASMTSQTRTSRRFSKKDVSDEALHGYEWLGKSSPWKEHITRAAANVWHNQAIALLLLALMVTVVAFIISQMTSFCWGVINYVYTNKMYNEVLIFLGCLVLKCGFVFAAIFFTITTPQTAGSGIPELKAILSGIWIRRYLSIRGFFIKSLALVCALGSGLPIGIEGPVIHISAIIGRQLTKISMFQHIDRKMLLSAACACGIAVIFSAPIGGVLFSIEVTHHYYKINSYWSAFLCATFAALFTTIVQAIAPTTLQLLHTSFTQEPYQTYEFIIFIILGAISGFLGASYVQLHKYFTLLRPKIARFHNGFWNNSYVLAGLVTSTYVLCAFILGEFAFQPSRMAISDLFNAASLEGCTDPAEECNFTDWGQGLGVYWNLFCFSILNYLFSIWFLVLDWPCGCFASVFAIGAASGRLLGEVLNKTIMDWSNTSVLAATYAVVGAASLVGGVTRTFSVAVIVIEMTLTVELSVPVLLGVIISWTIASWLSDSLYDSILNLRGIPLLPITPKNPTNFTVKPPRPYMADDLMVDIKEYGYLNDKSSYKEVALMLEHSNEIFFPVLDQRDKRGTLMGEVSRQILEEELKRHGYGKHTHARHKLLRDATKRLQAVSMFNLNLSRSAEYIGHPSRDRTRTDPFGSPLVTDTSDDDMISIRDDDHFVSLLDDAEVKNKDETPSILKSISKPTIVSQTQAQPRGAPLPGLSMSKSHPVDLKNVNRNDGKVVEEVQDQEEVEIVENSVTIHKKPTQSMTRRKSRRHKRKSRKKWDEKEYFRHERERKEWIDFRKFKWSQHMNISPVTVIPTMPISQIYILFHVLHPDKIYVAKHNQLVGVIDEQILLERERIERKGKDANTSESNMSSNGNDDDQNQQQFEHQEDYHNIDIH